MRRVVAWLAVVGGAGGAPDFMGPEEHGYFGSGPDDVWNGLRHWDGHAWSDVPLPDAFLHANKFGPAGEGKAWVAVNQQDPSGNGLYRVAVDGTVEDFTAQLGERMLVNGIARGPDGTVGITSITRDGTSGKSWWELVRVHVVVDDVFELLPPLPPEGPQILPHVEDLVVFGPDDVVLLAPGVNYRWDGAAWSWHVYDTATESSPVIPGFPRDDVWVGFGPGSSVGRPMHYDGTTWTPVDPPVSDADYWWFGYGADAPFVLHGTYDEGGGCDDTYTVCTDRTISFRRTDLDGDDWVERRGLVARVRQCSGPNCGYRTGGRIGFAGRLDDGTTVLVGPPVVESPRGQGSVGVFLLDP